MAAVNSSNRIEVRVLPVQARIAGYRMPRSAFSLYTYPDPDDPVVATVDTVTSDLVLTEKEKVAPYQEMYGRLREATLSPEDSMTFIGQAAEGLDIEMETAS
jgi:hypothetical protein